MNLQETVAELKVLYTAFSVLSVMDGNEPIRCSRMHFEDWAETILEAVKQIELDQQLAGKKVRDERFRDYIEDLATDVDSVATSLHPQMIHERTLEDARKTLRDIANTMRKAADRQR